MREPPIDNHALLPFQPELGQAFRNRLHSEIEYDQQQPEQHAGCTNIDRYSIRSANPA